MVAPCTTHDVYHVLCTLYPVRHVPCTTHDGATPGRRHSLPGKHITAWNPTTVRLWQPVTTLARVLRGRFSAIAAS